ncbi:ABC transporter permease [Nocardioides sp. IC4_145]|uniref:ABC transporter permease n=1 Tax=Nocardioides sp. IC4_145 TaxID=2714037 RepID=UPI00140AB59C|nr:ABC transporter permease [Nocardioides sp. IC4_145]NHC25276.1 ABC transporter permease [Nocardioides sp. IC4_145]
MSEFLTLVVPMWVVFTLAAQGTILSGRTGVFNVTQEGVMALGASVGFVVAYKMGSNLGGLLIAFAVGALVGLVLTVMTTQLRLDQFVVGLALFFAATGAAGLLYREVIGVTMTPPKIDTLTKHEIPLLSDIPVIGEPLFRQDYVFFFVVLLSVGLYWFMQRTGAGLNFRSVGENPKAADSLGINVNLARTWSTIVGSGLVAVAGAYFPLHFTGIYTDGMIAGRGWLVIALAFLGGWRPLYVVAGAAFFAGMDVLGQKAQVIGLGVPHQFIEMLPYVATLLVMVFAFRWARQPAHLGSNYDRESRLAG